MAASINNCACSYIKYSALKLSECAGTSYPESIESGSAASSESSVAAKCDIGKLLHLAINQHCLTREEKYNILVKKPNP